MEDKIYFKICNGILVIDNMINLNSSLTNKISKLSFSIDYIENNYLIVVTVIKSIISKNNISICMINTDKYLKELLSIIEECPSIKSVIFKKDLTISKELIQKISTNSNINYVNCYDAKIKEKNSNIAFNRRKLLTTVAILPMIIFVITLISLAIFSTASFMDNNEKEKINDDLIEINQIRDNNIAENKSNTDEATYTNVISESSQVNSDVVGWIKINNTTVDYPVVQTKDNDYYLFKDIKKQANSKGWIFMDYRNNSQMSDKNTIIYGHNIASQNIMFHGVATMFDNNYLNNKDNQYIYYYNKDADMKFKIFSMYIINDTNDYLKTSFQNNDEFNEFINMLKNRSKYSFDTEVNPNDKIITLSTCHSDVTRYVVHAVLIN